MGGLSASEIERNLRLIKLGYRFGKDGKLSMDQIENLLKSCASV